MYDGGTSLGTQYINESILVTQAQGGRTRAATAASAGWSWERFTISSGTLKVVLGNNASGNFVDADGVLIVSHGGGSHARTLARRLQATASLGSLAIGTLDQTQPASGPSTKKGSSSATTTAATIAISGVTQASPVTVVYSQAPAQGNPTTSPSMVDLAFSQNGNGNGSTQNGNADVITSLALGLLSGKKVIA